MYTEVKKTTFINMFNKIIKFNTYIQSFMEEINMDINTFNKYYSLLDAEVDLMTYLIREINFICDVGPRIYNQVYNTYYINILWHIIRNANIKKLDKLINDMDNQELNDYYINLKNINNQFKCFNKIGKFYYYTMIPSTFETICINKSFIEWDTFYLLENIYLYYNGLYKLLTNEDEQHNMLYVSFICLKNIKYKLRDTYFKYIKNHKYEKNKIYEEELIKETWKPERLIDWCLDEEEKRDIIC